MVVKVVTVATVLTVLKVVTVGTVVTLVTFFIQNLFYNFFSQQFFFFTSKLISPKNLRTEILTKLNLNGDKMQKPRL